ncbi:ATP synthase gamma chain [Geobacter sp. OR-1]|uniref:F0F1 ATP synthase subunit gamma n=1 Tax=Geobacter sp. OR-1 TaxID=1266765 RepID=UPI000543116B|nr:F0F1 ATP synthase subunit gamma [Geobacter sp. OR-1]GAM08323.1 ATP synthase gamma chain [Geobacter sp. OR-1]
MAGRRELQRRLRSLSDIDTILGVMKNLAMMEAGKLSRILVAQREMVTSLEDTASDFMTWFPPPQRSSQETKVLLLVGSQRGLCGDFNDLLLAALPQPEHDNGTSHMISVGAKLAGRLQVDTHLDGPHAVEEIGQVIYRVMDAINALLIRADSDHNPLRLSALYHDPDSGIVEVRTLAPLVGPTGRPVPSDNVAPHLNIAPSVFYAQLMEQHLLAAITELFHRSLMSESRYRLNHIEGASHRIERRVDELQRKQNIARQEEIIEEIEAILAGVGLNESDTEEVKPVTRSAKQD